MTYIVFSGLQLSQSTKAIACYFSTTSVKSAWFSVAPVTPKLRLILPDKQFPNVHYLVRGKSRGLLKTTSSGENCYIDRDRTEFIMSE